MWSILAGFACLVARVHTLTFVCIFSMALALDLTDFPAILAAYLSRRKDRS